MTGRESLVDDRRYRVDLTREEVGYVLDAVTGLTRLADIDNPYPALLRRFQAIYRREPDGECRTCGQYTKPCACEAMP